MASLAWGAATDAGRIRDSNEDAFVAESMVFVVADGMGGHQAGEVASALAATTLRDRLERGATSVDVVVAAVVEANAAIFQAAHTSSTQRGMGTTLTAIALLPADDGVPEQLALVNVGDSRTYLRRDGMLIRATVDHSYVQELLATGHISEAEARNHPRRNIVTRALGIEPSVRVDSWTMPLVRNDRFVLCSDGLVDEVDDHDILRIIQAEADPQAAAEALVAAALANGGRDNVTVIVLDVLDGLDPEELGTSDIDESGLGETVDGEAASGPLTLADPAPPAEDMPAAPAALPPPTPTPHTRQLTGKLFLGLLAAAVVATVAVTLFAVALTGDDQPAPTTTTTSTTTSTTSTTTTSTTPTTVAPTTLPGATTSP